MAHGLKDWTRGVWQAMSFLNLEDTPGSFVGQSEKLVRVNTGETALEFIKPVVDIPSGTIVLFESDTAVSGYTLLTDKDDLLVYITKGSAAGGEAGGTDKSSGTWTQPAHSHTGPSHKHETPVVAWNDVTVASVEPSGWPHGTGTSYAASGVGRSGAGTVAVLMTSAAGNSATSSDSPPNTWRPAGRNFTRQQKN